MELTHIRTENGTATLITTRAALDEINAGTMGPTKKLVREMSAARSSADILYRDGRKVHIRPATPEQIAEHTAPATPGVAPEPVYRTLKGAKVGDVITLWTRGGNKGPAGDLITVTIDRIGGGWYVTTPDRERRWFLGGAGSKYWVVG